MSCLNDLAVILDRKTGIILALESYAYSGFESCKFRNFGEVGIAVQDSWSHSKNLVETLAR